MMWCAISRYRISHRCDTGRPLGPLVRRHVERCPLCRQYERNLSDLANRLAEDARRDVPDVSLDLHQRILQAVEAAPRFEAAASEQTHRAPHPRLRLYVLSGLAAAAAVLLTVTILQVVRRDTGPVAPPISNNDGGGVAEILPELLEIPGWVLTEVSEPFANEVRELKTTGKKAARLVLDHASWLLGDDLPVLNGDAG